MNTRDIHIRDPFVYRKGNAYYMYGTTDANCWNGKGAGFTAYLSFDLNEWTRIGNVFDKPHTFWGTHNFWAPELHAYMGKYYLLASFKADGRRRATAALKADSPEGPFRPWGDEQLTPYEWECLDGTLYVEDDIPYLIFCHEWVQVGDGEICARRLKRDLSGADGDVITLFSASQAGWTRAVKHSSGVEGYVTDGPFMYRARNGALTMLWSSLSETGYAIGRATSESGALKGAWRQSDEPVFSKDGGHGMIFTGINGKPTLSIHAPNKSPDERPLFIELNEKEHDWI